MTPARTVFVIDDDEAVRKALAFLLRAAGFAVEVFAAARDFLAVYDPARRGCLVLDVRMPHMSGLDLQQEMNARGWRVPAIFITGHGTVATAIAALRAGAFDFIEKPLREDALLDAIERALSWDESVRQEQAKREELEARAGHLTGREREVMALIAEGESNKTIARRLDISFRTVEIHRARVMEKMQARTTSDLVRMAIALEGDRKDG
jgi:two-component system, LuxR family, response regulator FixJ